MPPTKRRVKPLTFFLNETHQLALDKGGGGSAPKYADISWAAKALQISSSLRKAVKSVKSSKDPLRDERFFVIAHPVPEVEKRSDDKKKFPEGTFKEGTDFGGQHARVFDRLGLDLLQVTDDGEAVVHAQAEHMGQLVQHTELLEQLGAREQARWVTIDSFGTIPLELRIDGDWLKTLNRQGYTDVVIELQPVLARSEADRVLRAIADLLAAHDGGKLTGTGSDFSGRHWFRGEASRQSIRKIARDFFSVQAIHSPLFSIAAGKKRKKEARGVARPTQLIAVPPLPPDPHNLPCVAVLDMGVPTDHRQLADYRRGRFIPRDAPPGPVGEHGAFVASRIVFGEHASMDDLVQSSGRCSYYDAIVADYPDGSGLNNRVDDKVVMEAMSGVQGAAPDVRVFNLSFDHPRPLNAFSTVERDAKRRLVQDIDNFVFANDAVVVVAAGNSRPGVIPNPEYPRNYEDAQWALGPLASGFNTLVCGSFAPRVATNGLAQVDWPSPFSRVGPGLCDAPVPSFGAEGGNANDAYRSPHGHGVWGFSGAGLPEDRAGTSYAAPILAREAALTLDGLQSFCPPGTRPFAVTARAFLTLVAKRPSFDERINALADRTLGNGKATATRLAAPAARSAVVLWQGYIESPSDIVRVQMPIPRDWLAAADKPILRLVVSADPPVNEVAHSTWACRKIIPLVRPGHDVNAIRAPGGGHPSFPCIDRRYNLTRYKLGNEKAAKGDIWLVDLSYEEKAPYPPAMDFDPRQRVAFAAELYDAAATQADPQPALQALPIAASMTRLSVQPAPIRSPVIIRTR